MLLTLVAFFAVLGILVLAHEAGHYFAARRFGIKIDEFGLGLPPRAFGFYRDENKKIHFVGPKRKQAENTIWSLNWIPLGGFVKIKGEEGENNEDPDSFSNQKVWKRMIVVSAGVTMNIILAAILLTIGLTAGSPQMVEEGTLPKYAKVRDVNIRIMEILKDSPAEQAGLEVGDIIESIDGEPFTKIENLQNYLSDKNNTNIKITYQRDQASKTVEVTPVILAETNRGGIGVALVQTGFVSYPWYISWYYGLKETFVMISGVIYGFYLMIKSLIVSGEVVGEVYGPVGIATLIGDAAAMGFLYILQFTAVLSVIIAVINFVPFPALDGGRFLFMLIEAIRRKPVNQRIENLMHNLGFALLMILVVIVTFKDIARISGGFINWWNKIVGLF